MGKDTLVAVEMRSGKRWTTATWAWCLEHWDEIKTITVLEKNLPEGLKV